MKKSFIIVFLILVVCFFSWFGFGVLTQAGGDDNTSGYAWSENIGWVSFNSTSDESPVDYGVNIDEVTGYLAGYAWSENIGWVSFERTDTGAPPSNDPCSAGGCIAKVSDPTKLGSEDVAIVGWARVLANDSSWDGWIRFDHGQPNEPYIDTNGDWHGWAWSDIVVGWLSFNKDEGGGSDYKVSTSISVSDEPPVADAGIDRTVTLDDLVQLDGRSSHDPEDCPSGDSGCTCLTYTWSFVSIPAGSSAVLSDSASCQPTFTADKLGLYEIQLTVTDSDTNSDALDENLQITAVPPAPPPPPGGDLWRWWETKP